MQRGVAVESLRLEVGARAEQQLKALELPRARWVVVLVVCVCVWLCVVARGCVCLCVCVCVRACVCVCVTRERVVRRERRTQ